MIEVGASLPTKRDGVVHKVPPVPFEAKIGGTVRGQKNMIVTALVIHAGLKMVSADVARDVGNVVEREGEVTNPEVEETLIVT